MTFLSVTYPFAINENQFLDVSGETTMTQKSLEKKLSAFLLPDPMLSHSRASVYIVYTEGSIIRSSTEGKVGSVYHRP